MYSRQVPSSPFAVFVFMPPFFRFGRIEFPANATVSRELDQHLLSWTCVLYELLWVALSEAYRGTSQGRSHSCVSEGSFCNAVRFILAHLSFFLLFAFQTSLRDRFAIPPRVPISRPRLDFHGIVYLYTSVEPVSESIVQLIKTFH